MAIGVAVLAAGGLLAGVVELWRHASFLPHGPWVLSMLLLGVLGVSIGLGWLWHQRRLRRLQEESDQRRDRILNGTNDGWWDVDFVRGESFVSERWREMHGLSPGEAISVDWRDLLHPKDKTRVLQELREYLRDAQCLRYELEFRCLLRDGRTIWVLARGICERGADGRVRRMSGSCSDITRFKIAEREREVARHLVRGIAAHVPGMVYQLRMRADGTGYFPYASPAIMELFGVTPQQAQAGADFLRDCVHPDDLGVFEASLRDSAQQLGLWQHEFRLLLPDGSCRWLLSDARPRRLIDGDVVWAGFITDVTARKNQELALQDALRRTQAILDSMIDGVITIDTRGIMTSANAAAMRMFGYEASELLGRNVSMLMPEPHRSQHDGYLDRYQRTGEARVLGIGRDVEGQRKDGSRFPMHLSVSKTLQHGQTVFIGLVQDISQRRRDEEEIHRLAFFDPLTGLPNRRLLQDRLQHALAGSGRSGRHGAVMFLDLDNFKLLNDTQGHDMGDLLLCQVAGRLRENVREADTVARLGGDEFVVLLESLSPRPGEAAAQVEVIAQKVLRALGQPYQIGELQHRSTPSIGAVLFLSDAVSMEDLLKMADVAMYQAKAAGRNTVCFYDPAMQAELAARAALEADMRQGLRTQEFLLHYQPQVDRHGDTVGFEALLRWQHPQRGSVPPGQFIPLAEESGLIGLLGNWVLEAACTQLVRWAGQPAMALCTVSVNVSAQQLGQPDFVAGIEALLARSGARPERLKLELTESMLADDVEAVIDKMLALKRLGVGFSLDDFGTGYSSLSYLKRLPLDQLKIDQSFVRDLFLSAHAGVIARTIIGLGHSLGLAVIAEGVETEAQHHELWQAGCDAFQGYLLGWPAPADQAEARMREALATPPS
ncbi:EAL domain-containing protein [Pseudorhodoferax sp.]|uniref:sensor domain-containing protein n=1 Tax=Pseudorhodoferax sp. TaxID=1993553 RepID=UPI0039E3CCCC